MNYLKNKKCYLCGSILMAKDDGVQWREMVTNKLNKFGVEVLNPCKKVLNGKEIGDDKARFKKIILNEKWGEIKKEFWPVVRTDLRFVDHSDFLIFNYDAKSPTIGSVHELVVANFEKKIILLKYNKKDLKFFNPWICTFIKEHNFFSDWNKMFEYLEGINNGKFDTSLWVLNN